MEKILSNKIMKMFFASILATHQLTSINSVFHSLDILLPVVTLSLKKLASNEDIIPSLKS